MPAVVHMRGTETHTTCGITLTIAMLAAEPQYAKFVTCKRCLAILKKIGT